MRRVILWCGVNDVLPPSDLDSGRVAVDAAVCIGPSQRFGG